MLNSYSVVPVCNRQTLSASTVLPRASHADGAAAAEPPPTARSIATAAADARNVLRRIMTQPACGSTVSGRDALPSIRGPIGLSGWVRVTPTDDSPLPTG